MSTTSNWFFNMKYLSVCLLLAVFAFSANGGQDDGKDQGDPGDWSNPGGQDVWQEIRVTYNDDKNAKGAFNKLPLTRADAEKAGWKQIGSKTAGCGGVGYRYMLNNDPAAVPIYAENGAIVGIQNGVSESKLNDTKLVAWYKQQPMFQVEHPEYDKSETLYTLKVYTCDPDLICNKDYKYAHNIFYTNGTKKTSVPSEESKLDPVWIKGKCNQGKGLHYFFNISKDMSCNDWQPFFPLYRDGKLVGFSFASFGEYQLTSTRYGQSEYHPSEQLKNFFIEVPQCLYTFGHNLTTLHAYLIESPWDLKCEN